MIHYPHPHNEQHHNENIAHWWAYETNKYLQGRLRNLVVRANWNKIVVRNASLSDNDLEIHQHRFEGFISQLKNIEKQLKIIGLQYNEQRINKLKIIFTKIKNYDSKTNI